MHLSFLPCVVHVHYYWFNHLTILYGKYKAWSSCNVFYHFCFFLLGPNNNPLFTFTLQSTWRTLYYWALPSWFCICLHSRNKYSRSATQLKTHESITIISLFKHCHEPQFRTDCQKLNSTTNTLAMSNMATKRVLIKGMSWGRSGHIQGDLDHFFSNPGTLEATVDSITYYYHVHGFTHLKCPRLRNSSADIRTQSVWWRVLAKLGRVCNFPFPAVLNAHHLTK